MSVVAQAPTRCAAPSVESYKKGCICLGCRAEMARDSSLRRAAARLHPRTAPRMVDSAPVRDAVRAWRSEGFYWREIAQVLELSVPRTIEYASDEPTTVDRRLAEKVHLLRPVHQRREVPAGMVDATGSVRRLQGLALLGFGSEEIAEHFPLGIKRLSEIRNGKCSWISEVTYEQIRALTMELVVRPPVARTEAARRRRATVAARARTKDWSSLAAWEDLDDPACVPTGETRAMA